MPPISIRTEGRQCEVAWFSAICSDDYEFLGVPDGSIRSSYEHCGDIVRKADALGYQNILLPSGWIAGQDALAFASAMAPQTQQINLLVALRMGEVWPPMLARALSTLDHILKGRLTINIISSDMPGIKEDNQTRYDRSSEIIQILQGLWRTDGPYEFKGKFYDISLPTTEPAKPYQQNGGPLMYFGGISPAAQDLCAKHCDVFLMWPETEDRIAETMRVMSEKAAGYGRKIDFGFRSHVIVRETEAEARAAADRLISKLDAAKGAEIKARSQDSKSLGVLRQDELRAQSKDLYIEDHLWSGIGLARSGCASAIVGDPDQVLAKLNRYMDMGMRAFVLSGYPHLDECDLFAKYVLPKLPTCRINELQNRRVVDPVTPLTTAERR
ncbi:MAG: LLM class flavin-dependent oxidoreductase [Prosthecobacter sp.]|jgi:alkanesulfonate monooxygenase|uniref:LLM class flavin-dependent oxidoreductase n=1 Tax=Prosthecobacter sp. TaxID=1965333 RepID=UPI0019F9DEC0|nr:LLM class flavin-dependent oxidoreductase [Prosthecobacter sp.]MBE2284712.1 LLM class flavin-dependent oxidoreductase [Prosthecobacter sp.]